MNAQDELKSKQKRKRFEDWMKGDHVLLQLDARKAGVEVPAHLEDNPALTLKLSYGFQGDISHDDVGIVCYLRFSGNYLRCAVPWTAIWGMNADTGEQQIWSEDVPREVVMQLAKQKISELGRKLFGKEGKPGKETIPTPVAPDPAKQESDLISEKPKVATSVSAPKEQEKDPESNPPGQPSTRKPQLRRVK